MKRHRNKGGSLAGQFIYHAMMLRLASYCFMSNDNNP